MTCARRLAGAQRPASSTSALATSADSPRGPEPRPGRFRARLCLLLPAAALLLGGLSLFAAAPASAQVWSATLTVEQATGVRGCGTGAGFSSSFQCSNTSTLTTDDFSYGGSTYTVSLLSVATSSSKLEFRFSGLTGAQAKTALTGLTLNLGANSFAIADATASGNVLDWPSTLSWSAGDTVAVSLTEVPMAPGAPTNLLVSPLDGSLSLTWTAPAGTLTGYDVHYTSATSSLVADDATAGSNHATAWVAVSRTEVSPPTASQTISSVANGTLYRVRVRAKNAVGNGAWAFETGTPAVPPPVTVSFLLDTLLIVELDTTPDDLVVLLSSAQLQSVTVGISVVAAESTASAADYTLSATSVTFEAGSTSATFTILATADMMDDGGNEQVTLRLTPPTGVGVTPAAGRAPGNSLDLEIVIVDDSQPVPILNVTPGSGSLALTWNDPLALAANGWDVHYTSAPKTGTGAVTDTAAATGTDAAAAWVAVTRTGTAQSQTISSLSNGTTYRLRVRSFILDINNMPTIKGDWIFGSGTPKAPPAAPTGLSLSSLETSFEATWTASTSTGAAAPTWYEVAFDVATVAVTNLSYAARTTSGTATSLTIDSDSSGLTIQEATEYRAAIRACNPSCSGYAGNETVWTSVLAPANIVNLAVTPGDETLALSWTVAEPSGGQAAPTGYEVAYTTSTTVLSDTVVGTDPATGWVDAGHGGTGTSYVITGLTNGQAYRVRVQSLRVVNGSKRDGERAGFGAGTPEGTIRVTLGPAGVAVDEGKKASLNLVFSRCVNGHAKGIPVTVTRLTSEGGVGQEDHDFALGNPSQHHTFNVYSWMCPTGNVFIDTYEDADHDDETFRVDLNPDHPSWPDGYVAGAQSRATVTIRDAVPVSISAFPNPVPEGKPVRLAVWLAGVAAPSPGGLAVPMTVTRDTSEAGDHGELSSVTIPAGVNLRRVEIPTALDEDDEHETFTVALGALPAGYVASDGYSPVRVTIADAGASEPPADPNPPADPGPPGDPGPPAGPGPPGGGGGPPPPPDDEGDDEGGGGPPPGGGSGGPPRAEIETDAECEAGLCRARTGEPVSFRDAGTGVAASRLWDFGDGRTSASGAPARAWAEPGFYTVTLLVSDGSVESTDSLTFLVEAAEPAGACVADEWTRCLGDSRYAVETDWSTAGGESGTARVVREGSNESALFHFFGEQNWEVLIKVLDGCEANGHAWVFGASTTDLGYVIRVTDTATGNVREYRNEPGTPAAGITDVKAFPDACGND